MKYISAFVSFAFVFAGAFFLAGWFLMPHLPPIPDHPVSVFESDYWRDNWIGYLLGATLGGLSARSVLKKATKKGEGT
jgi:Na+/phosphate symporter